ncbi:hypothetical protein BU15DRAFT_68656 [Melanogaster broomeanus]|nr:hypothetical protein BU15DRAFT_68656 [Melanogaster broomeanus]
MSLRNPLFIDCCRRQRSSLEIVVYSSDVRQIVELAYTYWECFCALITGDPTPARFVDMVENGHIVRTNVVCHPLYQSVWVLYVWAKFSILVNLNETHHTAMLTSNYPEFPTTARGSIVDVERLVIRFHSTLARTNLGHAEIAPFFDDYLGTLVSRYPGHAMSTKSVDFATIRRARTHFRRHSGKN